MPIRIGARGGGNNLYFVDILPPEAVAIDDAVYVLPAGTFWKIFQQPVAAVPAVPSSIARTAIMDSPNGIWLGALMAAPALPATRSFYFGSPVTDREFYDSTGPTDPWTVTDIMTVRAEPNAIWLGDDVDTDDEAREYFRINGFNSSDTYYYYESTSETVDQVTAYTPMGPGSPRPYHAGLCGNSGTQLRPRSAAEHLHRDRQGRSASRKGHLRHRQRFLVGRV